MTPNADYVFQNRWRIEGTLTTDSPLHVGSGGTTTRDGLLNEQAAGKLVEIAAVLTGHDQRPCISGSALKGNLRSWATRLPASQDQDLLIERLFGNLRAEEDSAGGGRLVFGNAPLHTAAAAVDHIPYYDPNRGTGVAARVALHRATKTALPGKLFHVEYVPKGATFSVVIDGQDLWEEDIVFVLALMEGFNAAHDPARLGAEMANGWGRCDWALTGVSRADAATVTRFLNGEITEGAGYELCQPLPASEQKALEQKAKDLALGSARAILTLDLELKFDGPLLVNDPNKCKVKSKKEKDKDDDENTKDLRPDHAPRLDPAGCAVLPASSIHGAFRARAEKIVRTLNPAQATPADHKPPAATAVMTFIEDIFGESGQASAVRFTDFTATKAKEPTRQEFIAIDRFTGGGADHLKFNAEHVHAPAMTGAVTVNLGRLEPAHLGLLALTLRDLIEGDIAFGMGWAKGYGNCTAAVTGGRLPGLAGLADWRDEAEFLGDLALGGDFTDPAAALAAGADALTMMLEKFQAHMAAKGK